MADIPIKILVDAANALQGIKSFTNDAQKSLDSLASTGEKLGSVLKLAAGAFASAKLVGALNDAVHAASEAEEAHFKFTNQLRLSGDVSEETLKGFEQLAQQIQKNTKFDDDAVLANIALAKSFGLTNTETVKVIKTATDLATVTGDDLATSVTKLAATYNLVIERGLKKVTPELRNLTDQELASGAAVDLLAEKVEGSATNALQIYAAASTQAGKAVDNFTKAVGGTVTSNETVKEVLQLVVRQYDYLKKVVEDNSEGLRVIVDIGAQLAKALISLATFAIASVIKGLGLLGDGINYVIKGFKALGGSYFDTKKATEEQAESTKELGEIEKETSDATVAARLRSSDAAKKAAEDVKKLEKELQVANDDTISKIEENADKQYEIVAAAELRGVKTKEQANALREQIEERTSEKIIEEQQKVRDKILGASSDIVTKTKADVEKRFRELDKALEDGALTEEQVAAERIRINENAEREITEGLKKQTAERGKTILDFVNSASKVVSIVVDVSDAIADLDKFQKSIPVTLQKIQDQNAAVIEKLIADIPKALQDAEAKIRKESEKRIKDLEKAAEKDKKNAEKTTSEKLKKDLEGIQKQFDAGVLSESQLVSERTRLQTESEVALAQQKEQIDAELLAKEQEERVRVEEEVLAKTQELREQLEQNIAKKRQDLEEELIKRKFELEEELAKKQEERQKKEDEAATKLVAGIASAIGETLLPGVGGAVGTIVDGLSKGSDFLSEAVLGIADSVPKILENLGEGIAKLADGIVDNLPKIVEGFINGAAKFAAAIQEALPSITIKLVEVLSDPDTWIKLGITMAMGIAESFVAMVKGLLKNIPIIGDAISGESGSGSSTLDAISNVLDPIGVVDFVSGLFSHGGEVPKGFPNDTFRAGLSSGEVVIPRDTVIDLKSFLADQRSTDSESAGEKQVTVILKLNDKQLSEAVLDLNRRGFRMTS